MEIVVEANRSMITNQTAEVLHRSVRGILGITHIRTRQAHGTHQQGDYDKNAERCRREKTRVRAGLLVVLRAEVYWPNLVVLTVTGIPCSARGTGKHSTTVLATAIFAVRQSPD